MFGLTDGDVNIMLAVNTIRPSSILELSQYLGKPYPWTYRHVTKLSKMGVLHVTSGRHRAVSMTEKGEKVLNLIMLLMAELEICGEK